MGGHVTRPDEGTPLGHRGSHGGVGEDPLLPERLREFKGEPVLAKDYRDDGGFAEAGVEAQGGQFSLHPPRVFPEPLPPLRLSPDDVQGGADGGHAGRGEAGAEHEGAGLVPQVVDDVGPAGHEAPDGGQGLAAGTHDQIHLILQTEVLRGAAALLAQDAGGVGVVHHDPAPVLPGEADDLGQVGDIPLHAEDAIHHHELPPPARLDQGPLQVGHVVVAKPPGLAEGEAAAVHDAGVVQAVCDQDIPLAAQRREDPQIRLESGGEQQGGLLPLELGQLSLHGLVELQVPAQEAGPTAAGAVSLDRLARGLLDFGMGRQAEVVVGPDHDHPSLPNDDLGLLRRHDGLEVHVPAGRHQTSGGREPPTLLKELHPPPSPS